jgi:hypothetical protein
MQIITKQSYKEEFYKEDSAISYYISNQDFTHVALRDARYKKYITLSNSVIMITETDYKAAIQDVLDYIKRV